MRSKDHRSATAHAKEQYFTPEASTDEDMGDGILAKQAPAGSSGRDLDQEASHSLEHRGESEIFRAYAGGASSRQAAPSEQVGSHLWPEALEEDPNAPPFLTSDEDGIGVAGAKLPPHVCATMGIHSVLDLQLCL